MKNGSGHFIYNFGHFRPGIFGGIALRVFVFFVELWVADLIISSASVIELVLNFFRLPFLRPGSEPCDEVSESRALNFPIDSV